MDYLSFHENSFKIKLINISKKNREFMIVVYYLIRTVYQMLLLIHHPVPPVTPVPQYLQVYVPPDILNCPLHQQVQYCT